ncbi:hypothetical protein ACSBR1_012034 [Camellia fascicularis]
MINLSQNKLYGQVPRSLAICIRLEILVFGNNEIEDTVPFCLGDLPKLQVLVLRFNRFHGTIKNLKTNLKFPKLCIMDLSHNGFSGNLPSKLFQNWNAMKMKKAEKLNVTFIYFPSQMTIMYSITIISKGIPILYWKIQNGIVVVDLSNNKFKGQIPKALGSLCGLKLESLDLPGNLLSGEIPPQLSQLTFLEFLNVSYNHLTGPIPRGKQFDIFENYSYLRNPGLCGKPLSKSCENLEASTPPPLSF